MQHNLSLVTEFKLSADGRTLVVGRKNEMEIDAGGVVVFRYIEEEDIWTQLGDEITGLSPGDAFGRHLAASFGEWYPPDSICGQG